MKKNKGFTLVELLAVIVILAVIALISTPVVLSMIESSRQGAAESSALSYVDATEKAILTQLMTNSSTDYTGTYTVNALVLTKDSTTITTDLKGDRPTSGTVVVSKTTVTKAQLKFGSYYVTYTYDTATGTTKYCSNTSAFTDSCS
jgi:prepilin-type N-terminal cleavage/methylation domain-containing protein